MKSGLAAAVGALVVTTSGVGRGQTDYFDRPEAASEMTYRVSEPRSDAAWIALATLAGATLVTTGAGLALHLSGNAKADSVSASTTTGQVWTRERQDDYDSAVFRRRLGYAGYAIGGGLLVATVVTFFATDPGTRVVRARGEDGGANAHLEVETNGARVSLGWRF